MTDSRWSGTPPWFLRSSGFTVAGNFELFLTRVSQRLERFLRYNEANVQNLDHFAAWLESESFQRFRFDNKSSVVDQIRDFFDPGMFRKTVESLCYCDQEEENYRNIVRQQSFLKLQNSLNGLSISVDLANKRKQSKTNLEKQATEARLLVETTKKQRFAKHYQTLALGRLTVLEAMLRILPKNSTWLPYLIQDIRRHFAEAKITLDIRSEPPTLVPLDESLLQKEVIDKALERISKKFPDRAKELIEAYHSLISGKNLDSVFSEAFKTLEELARSLTKCRTFEFKRAELKKYFPGLHPTIHETIMKLAGHRGDEAGHGRAAPDDYEMRYLLFSICNIALLLLEYSETTPVKE